VAKRQRDSLGFLLAIEGISDRYVSSLLPLAFLAPDIVDAIAAGRQPTDPDRPSSDQDRGASDRVGGTEAAARPRLTEAAHPNRTANS